MVHAIPQSQSRFDPQKKDTPATLADFRKNREYLKGMLLELRANHVVLNHVRDWYGVFAFTGGDVPTGRCDFRAVTSYMELPLATKRISMAIDRYRHLVEAAMEPMPGISTGPKTLRCRKDIADAFGRAYSEIQSLETALVSDLAKLMKELETSPPTSEIY